MSIECLFRLLNEIDVNAMSTLTLERPFSRSATDAPSPAEPRRRIGSALRAILARHDDRLLRDIGLTREDVLGPEDAFLAEWNQIRAPWSL